MGEQGGIDFNTTPPTKFTSAINSIETTASISDKNTGELLFYTDGATIWDASHSIMQNGHAIGQEKSPYTAVQGAVIVPFINNTNKYYVFSIPILGTNYNQLLYSVVDMTLNNGAGGVVPGSKKIKLADSMSEAMIAMQGCRMVWLVTQHNKTGSFHAFRITEEGIDPVSVISPLDYSKRPSTQVGIKASPDFKRIISIGQFFANIDGDPYIATHNFDAATGKITNGILLDTAETTAHYGCEFSPNGQRLYVTNGNSVYQYNLALSTPAAIAASKTPLTQTSTGLLYNLQRRSDGNIYIVRYNEPYLDMISNADAVVPGCILTQKAVAIGGRANTNLPQMIVYPLEPQPGTNFKKDTTICNGTPLQLRTTYQAATWQDGSKAPTFTATEPGIYWVRGYNTDCMENTDSFIVGEVTVDASLPENATLCFGDSMILNTKPHPQGTTYLWNDGSTDDSLLIKESGKYSVTVNNMSCSDRDSIQIWRGDKAVIELGKDTILCNDADMILPYSSDPVEPEQYLWQDGSTGRTFNVTGPGKYYVTVSNKCGDISDTIIVTGRNCSLFFPSAFSPNGDNLNDRARLLGDVAGVTDYQLSIYNRWGQQVFTTTNPLEGWNGMQGASLSDIGVYYYYIQYTYNGESAMMKGDLTLIR